MADLRLCFEADGLAQDENGKPCSVGMEFMIPGAKKEIPYEKLTSGLDLDHVLEFLGLSEIIGPENVRVITPEEYDKRYGGKKDGNM